jgi:hypothetical protein
MSKSNNRRISTEFQIDRLERRRAQLKAQIEELDKRLHLSAPEEIHLQRLKKEKLRMKDELETLRSA